MQTETVAVPPDDHHLHERIHAEFREMPGLKLTLRQASRLFDVDPWRCEQALVALVRSGTLHRQGDAFLGHGTGRHCA